MQQGNLIGDHGTRSRYLKKISYHFKINESLCEIDEHLQVTLSYFKGNEG